MSADTRLSLVFLPGLSCTVANKAGQLMLEIQTTNATSESIIRYLKVNPHPRKLFPPRAGTPDGIKTSPSALPDREKTARTHPTHTK